MAINKNHEFEELSGVKCAIVEKNVSLERANFLKAVLEFNKFTVVVVASPPAKIIPAAANAATETLTEPSAAAPPLTFTIGVTDVTFNPINAVFGRLLKTPDGHIVTLAYWQQKENTPSDDIPYFEKH